ncbi:hypothetical protein ACWEXP_00985 [Staphylococcus pseudoxylosus]|uniref:Uncharacterized protein n=1 Tax=Staphylococcus pseudoxylosus TaxID=2282419 RepID=A0AAQ0MHM9_9STAP|nr:hypothetical protein [Staphylococcus pseudoxylosus]MCE5003195.1 hypothetical protein [Staphylococcus pseudoxylosus]RMI85014.1 hypothetical protein D9V42_09155 [Staphylococcus pseudoxylosus]
MANEPIIFMKDDNDVNFYPLCHIEGLQGVPDGLTDLNIDGIKDDISGVSTNVNDLQIQLNSLKDLVANIPTVSDTGWKDITLATGIEIYSSGTVPQARLITLNNTSFLSVKGAVKGITSSSGVTIGSLNSFISSKISTNLYFVQNTSIVSGKPNFTRMSINTSGIITMQNSSIDSPTSTQWYPLHHTFIL